MRKIELRQKATKALLAILFFLVCYILLVFSAMALTVLCGYAGIMLIALKPTFITLMLGLGLIGLGCLVLFFLIKFLFKRNRTDSSGMVEIFEKDEPKLFALVRSLAIEIKTDFPKRMYLTSDVNASVFYDSSIWSMFFPTPKNLQIGLGLVNAVTESELKAILAHEFGHFSQKSMSIGSYVYNVNHVVYNLLSDNHSFDSIVQTWANISGYFTFFAELAIKIIKGIQWILVKLYAIVNISYFELSREMEFEADEIAASVAGSKPLADSLLRLSFAQGALDATLQFYGAQIQNNRKAYNIYPNHAFAMDRLALQYKLPILNALPVVSIQATEKFFRSRLVIKDQWASHPTTEERVERLNSLGYVFELHNGSAWNCFSNQEQIQTRLTNKMFEEVKYEQEPEVLVEEKFETLYVEHSTKYLFDERYLGYFDDRDIAQFDLENAITNSEALSATHLSDLLNEHTVDVLYNHKGIQNDIQLLEQIVSKQVEVSSFDFDGQRYAAKNAEKLLEAQKEELSGIEHAIKLQDKKVFLFFYHQSKQVGKQDQLKELYSTYFLQLGLHKLDIKLYSDLASSLQFIQVTTPFDQIRKNFVSVHELEKKLKERLAELLPDPMANAELDNSTRKTIDEFLSQEWVYFEEPVYVDNSLERLYTSMNTLVYLINCKSYFLKRAILQFQMDVVDGK